jgi:steroid delta-isomerase-like uncharacterized protein
MENLKEFIKPLYNDCFTVNTRTDVAAAMGTLLADEFVSHGSVDNKTKAQLIGQIQFFWKLVPDLEWKPQEILQDGNKVIVRSIATGTPKGDFMGTPTDGTKSFKIMTIDIHTVEKGQVRAIHHLEDWVTAMKQLRS